MVDAIHPHLAEGNRHNGMLGLAGAAAKSGWSKDSTRQLVHEMADALGLPERRDEFLRGVEDTYAAIEGDEPVAGSAILQATVGEDATREVLDALDTALANSVEQPAPRVEFDTITPEIAFTNGPAVYAMTPTLVAAVRASDDDFVVEGLAARHQVAVVAMLPKGGKTTLIAQLVTSGLRGEPFLDKETHLAENEDVLWLTEEPEDIFVPRLIEDFALTESEMARVLPAFRRRAPATYNWTKYLTTLNAELKARAERTGRRIGLVIVDTFAAWTGLDDDGEGKPGAVLKAFEPLYRRVEGTGAAVLVLHHTRKSGGRFGTGIRGSGAIAGAVDVIVEMERWASKRAPTTVRDIHVLGRRKSTCWDATLDYQEGRYVVRHGRPGGQGTPATLGEVQRRLLTALAAHEDGLARRALSEAAGVSPSSVKQRVRELVRAGWLRSDAGARGKETVYITDAGRMQLADGGQG